jgi:hypothetical protein
MGWVVDKFVTIYMQGECHLTNQDGHRKVMLIAIQIAIQIDIPSS